MLADASQRGRRQQPFSYSVTGTQGVQQLLTDFSLLKDLPRRWSSEVPISNRTQELQKKFSSSYCGGNHQSISSSWKSPKQQQTRLRKQCFSSKIHLNLEQSHPKRHLQMTQLRSFTAVTHPKEMDALPPGQHLSQQPQWGPVTEDACNATQALHYAPKVAYQAAAGKNCTVLQFLAASCWQQPTEYLCLYHLRDKAHNAIWFQQHQTEKHVWEALFVCTVLWR